MRKQPPFHRPADGLETLQSTQLSSPHASPLAFPTLGYSGPLCHCGGFHSATTQIKPEQEKHEKLEVEERRGRRCIVYCLSCFFFLIPTCQHMVRELIYGTAASLKQSHLAGVYNKLARASPKGLKDKSALCNWSLIFSVMMLFSVGEKLSTGGQS